MPSKGCPPPPGNLAHPAPATQLFATIPYPSGSLLPRSPTGSRAHHLLTGVQASSHLLLLERARPPSALLSSPVMSPLVSCLFHPLVMSAPQEQSLGFILKNWPTHRRSSALNKLVMNVAYCLARELMSENDTETLLVVQWLRVHAPRAGSQVPSLAAQGTKILHTATRSKTLCAAAKTQSS